MTDRIVTPAEQADVAVTRDALAAASRLRGLCGDLTARSHTPTRPER